MKERSSSDLISLQEAREKGLNRYFTGVPCKHGHISVRSTTSRACMHCISIKRKADKEKRYAKYREWYSRNLEYNVKRAKEWKKKNPEKAKAQDKRKYEKHKSKIVARATKWNKENKGRHRKTHKLWRIRNRPALAYYSAARRSAIRTATPPWAMNSHKQEMRKIYQTAKTLTESTGMRHEVDHIGPLNGKFVCGLHVPWNLQILTQSENRSKSNHMDIEDD